VVVFTFKGERSMPRIEWDVTFSVGDVDIDAQHQRWIAIHNELHELLVNCRREELKTASVSTIEAMLEYAKYHFSFEEEYIDRLGYPGKDNHVQYHRGFEVMVDKYLRDLRNGEIILNTELIKALKRWLEDHILTEDKKYAHFAAHKGATASSS
jgi:hemerythrin